jgi:hypothetical protein
MERDPTDGYAERLALALERGPKPMSVRGLAAAMGERFPRLRGTSYGGIRQYAEGVVRHPRVELLRAIAAVVGVRGDWLAFDEGGMTEAEELAKQQPPLTPEPGQVERTRAAVFAAFDEETSRLRAFGIGATERFVLPAVTEVAEWIGPGGLDLPIEEVENEQPGHGRYVEAARMLGRAVMAPLETMRLEPEYWTQGAKATYLATMIPMLTTLAELEHGLGAAVRAHHAARPEPNQEEEIHV